MALSIMIKFFLSILMSFQFSIYNIISFAGVIFKKCVNLHSTTGSNKDFPE